MPCKGIIRSQGALDIQVWDEPGHTCFNRWSCSVSDAREGCSAAGFGHNQVRDGLLLAEGLWDGAAFCFQSRKPRITYRVVKHRSRACVSELLRAICLI